MPYKFPVFRNEQAPAALMGYRGLAVLEERPANAAGTRRRTSCKRPSSVSEPFLQEFLRLPDGALRRSA